MHTHNSACLLVDGCLRAIISSIYTRMRAIYSCNIPYTIQYTSESIHLSKYTRARCFPPDGIFHFVIKAVDYALWRILSCFPIYRALVGVGEGEAFRAFVSERISSDSNNYFDIFSFCVCHPLNVGHALVSY